MRHLAKSAPVIVFLYASFFPAPFCNGAEPRPAPAPGIKEAFASLQRAGKPYKTFYNNYIAPHAVVENNTVFTAHQDGQGRPVVSAYEIGRASCRERG